MAAVAVPRWRVPLADVVVTEADIAAVADVYRSGWLSRGRGRRSSRRRFAEYTGARHAVAVDQRHGGAAPDVRWPQGSGPATR